MAIAGLTDVGALASYLVFVRQTAMPINQFNPANELRATQHAGAERVFAAMREEPEVDEGRVALEQTGKGSWEWRIPAGLGVGAWGSLVEVAPEEVALRPAAGSEDFAAGRTASGDSDQAAPAFGGGKQAVPAALAAGARLGDCARRRRDGPRGGPAAALRRRALPITSFGYEPGHEVLHDINLFAAGADHRVCGADGRRQDDHHRQPYQPLLRRRPARSPSTAASTSRTSRKTRCAARSASCCRTRICLRAPSQITFAANSTPPTRRCARRLGSPTRTASSVACRAGTTPWSPRTARTSPKASASFSPSRAPRWPIRRC